jgi:hypothetical protein
MSDSTCVSLLAFSSISIERTPGVLRVSLSIIAEWHFSGPSVDMGSCHSAPPSEEVLEARKVAKAKKEAEYEERQAVLAEENRVSEAARAEEVKVLNAARKRREHEERYGIYPTSTLPDHLFRVYHDKSKGTNTPGEFCSQGTRSYGSPAPYNSAPLEKIREHVAAHFNFPYSDRQYFVQFTASLLAALLQAERLDRDGYTNICIAVLTTDELEARSNIFPAQFLVSSYNIRLDDTRWLDLDEEFLIWDFGCFPTHHASLRVLREHGLYRLLPELKQRMQQCPLAIELRDFRKQLFDDSWAMDTTPKEVQLARTLASVFGDGGSQKLMFQLLCARKRNPKDPAWPDMARK